LLRFAAVLLPRRISWLAVCLGPLAGIRGGERLHLVARNRSASEAPSHSRTIRDVGLSDRTMDVPSESELLLAAHRGDPAASCGWSRAQGRAVRASGGVLHGRDEPGRIGTRSRTVPTFCGVAAPTASACCGTDGSRGGRHLLPGVGRRSPRVGGQRWLTVRGHQKGTFPVRESGHLAPGCDRSPTGSYRTRPLGDT
jgi:hypothetical protein